MSKELAMYETYVCIASSVITMTTPQFTKSKYFLLQVKRCLHTHSKTASTGLPP